MPKPKPPPAPSTASGRHTLTPCARTKKPGLLLQPHSDLQWKGFPALRGLMRCSLFFLTALVCAAADVVVERGGDYTSIPHGKLAMDIVRPKTPGKYPGVVLIHGGGFSGGNRDSYLPMAMRLA